MEINILVFGQLADIIGKMELKISDVRDTAELNHKLAEQYPALPAIKYVLAVNKIIVQENTLLRDADKIALLPPFSGG